MSRRPSSGAIDGFSLVEALVGSVLIVLALWGSTVTLMVTNRTNTGSRLQGQLEQLIERDLALISDLSERYTCCPGTCTTNPALIDPSPDCAKNSDEFGSEQYYTPVQPFIPIGGTYTTAMANFRNACTNGTGALASPLAGLFPVLPPAPTGATLTRSTPTVSDPVSHQLTWTYTATIDGSTVIRRDVNLIPRVANWCP